MSTRTPSIAIAPGIAAMALVLAACGDPELCYGQYGLGIEGLPMRVDRYHVVIEFEQHRFEIDCVSEGRHEYCEAPDVGDWTVTLYLDLEDTAYGPYPMVVSIVDLGEDRRIPRGEIVVRITSPDLPGQFVERRSNPSPEQFLSCEEAAEFWTLPAEWDVEP